jgi:hypothetical protein
MQSPTLALLEEARPVLALLSGGVRERAVLNLLAVGESLPEDCPDPLAAWWQREFPDGPPAGPLLTLLTYRWVRRALPSRLRALVFLLAATLFVVDYIHRLGAFRQATCQQAALLSLLLAGLSQDRLVLCLPVEHKATAPPIERFQPIKSNAPNTQD